MATKVPWDKHEAILLFDAFLTTQEGFITEKEAHVYVSAVLRQKAMLNGVQFDEKFRNVNGIRMQMDGLKYVYMQGTVGMSHSNKLFDEILQLYKTSRDVYRLLLKEANDLSGLSLYQKIPHPER